jgi:hypothetical protein
MATILTNEAAEGYASKDASGNWRVNPYLATSHSHNAWAIGRWLFQTGRTFPREVRASRGDSYHVNGMKVQINRVQGCTEIERVA